MKEKKVRKIDFSRDRYARIADKYYNEGNYVSALRYAYLELQAFGGDPDVYLRFADIYEGMGLHGSAINYWFRMLDCAAEEDLPDVYEGLAANFLAMGNEAQSAYYYNKLIDVDDQIPEEVRMDIADAFSTKKRDKFRFVYPPRLADYSKEVNVGMQALKSGDARRAVAELDKVPVGNKDYATAKDLQAVAHLLAGETEAAENVCLELLQEEPNDVRVLSTLAAVYLEQGKRAESRAIAEKLVAMPVENTDELYKVATVCCENEMHDKAFEVFCKLDSKLPYDGRTLYFKGVSAYKCGKLDEAERTLDELCSIYPDAEVAKYYLELLRSYRAEIEDGNNPTPPELIYFYHLPQAERERRCAEMLNVASASKDDAQLFGLLILHDGYLQWCFDELDGGDHDLQYLALTTAVKAHADEFIQDVLLDFEVADVLKIETLRMLLERNENMDVGIVLCNIYRQVPLYRIHIGRKRHKKFVEGYAKLASKFAVVRDEYSVRIAECAEELYRVLERTDSLGLVENANDCACAIFFMTGFKELGGNMDSIAAAFEADIGKVRGILACLLQDKAARENTEKNREESEDEMD